jgi:hypothetical protein
VSVPAVVLSAALDRRLLPRELRLYVFLCGQLDTETYRAVKHSWLERKVATTRPWIQKGLTHLVDLGYLGQGPRDGGLCTYRLAVSPPMEPQHKEERRGRAR